MICFCQKLFVTLYMTYIPLIAIAVSICVGFILGTVIVLYKTKEEIAMLEKELDYFRKGYFRFLTQFKDKYIDD